MKNRDDGLCDVCSEAFEELFSDGDRQICVECFKEWFGEDEAEIPTDMDMQ